MTHEIIRIGEGDNTISCPKCKQYNAMLWIYDTQGNSNLHECRNCKFTALVFRGEEDLELKEMLRGIN